MTDCTGKGYRSFSTDAFTAERQVTEPSRRLSYTPQCVGIESRLSDCSATEQSGSCDAPVVIRCFWRSSEVMKSQPSSTPAPSLSSTSNKLVPGTLLPTFTRPSMFKPQSSATKEITASPTATHTLVTDFQTVFPSPFNPSLSSPPFLSSEAVTLAVVGLVVLSLVAAIATFLVFLLWREKRKATKFRTRPETAVVYDMVLPASPNTREFQVQPYEVPISSRIWNDDCPETEAVTDTTTAGNSLTDADRYHRLIHFPVASYHCPPNLTTSSTSIAVNHDEKVGPSSSSQANQCRSHPKYPVCYTVVNSRERATEVLYDTLDWSREKVRDQHHQYDVLEKMKEGATENLGAKRPIDYDVLEQKMIVTLV